jgi:hypothetical protein
VGSRARPTATGSPGCDVHEREATHDLMNISSSAWGRCDEAERSGPVVFYLSLLQRASANKQSAIVEYGNHQPMVLPCHHTGS